MYIYIYTYLYISKAVNLILRIKKLKSSFRVIAVQASPSGALFAEQAKRRGAFLPLMCVNISL